MLGRPHIPRLRPPIQSEPYTPDKPHSSFTVSAPARGCISPAVAVLHRIAREEGNPWVITGRRPASRVASLHFPWGGIRKRAGLDDVRLHDLRHSFASGGLLVGEGLPMIGKLLGHSQVQTTARYAHLADDPVKAAADRIASRIARVAG